MGALTSSVPAGWEKGPLRFLAPQRGGGGEPGEGLFSAATCGANAAFAQTHASTLKRSIHSRSQTHARTHTQTHTHSSLQL